jgi:hypothetical protein
MVIDLASLRSGIALHLINTSLNPDSMNDLSIGVLARNHLITEEDFAKLKDSLSSLFTMIQDFEYRHIHQPHSKQKPNNMKTDEHHVELSVVHSHHHAQETILNNTFATTLQERR